MPSNNIIPIVNSDELLNVLDQLGAEHNMRRERPYDGQPWTDSGLRGNTEIKGVTMRDIKDCYIRAFVLSHSYFKDNTLERQEPNATFIDEAKKGENAVLCINDIYSLEGDIDPIAVGQNLTCEIEKLMGIFPNILKTDKKEIIESLFGKKPDDNTN